MTFSVVKKHISLIVLLINLICVDSLMSQDTIFLRNYTLDEPVLNVDGVGRYIIARTTTKIYRLNEDEEFEEILRVDPVKTGKHTWVGKKDRRGNYSTYHTDYLPPSKIIPYYPVGNFLPGYHHANITLAKDGNMYYVTFRGNILKYTIKDFYKIYNRWESVRDVYVDDSIKITSTYSAIYKDSAYEVFGFDTIKGVGYSNGEAAKIKGKYYLCVDNLYKLENNQWVKQQFQKDLKPNLKKLSVNKNETYYLSLHAFGRIDLNTNRFIDTILQESKYEYFDIEWVNNRGYVTSENGFLYVYEKDNPVKSVNIGSPIYDINISANRSEAILSCKDGVYKIQLSDLSFNKLFTLTDAIESVFVDDQLLITTLHGLYIYFEGGAKEIIPRIEFNKYGLSAHEELIFAGSIEGLYVLDKGMLLNNVLKSLQETEFKDKRQLQFNTGVILLVIALIVIAYLVYQNLKKKKESLRLMRKGTTINPEIIRQIVLENPKIISVEAIAEYFETSTVQLNRVLKKYDTSGLAVLKSIKQDIVKEMIEQDKSLEEISKRVGYSINYIKRNLL